MLIIFKLTVIILVYRMNQLIDLPAWALEKCRKQPSPPGGGAAPVQRRRRRVGSGPRRVPAVVALADRRQRAGLASDDKGVERPWGGACARLQSLCEPRRFGVASRHLPGPHRRSVRDSLSARRQREAVRARLYRGLRDRLCELVRGQLGASRCGHSGRSGQVRRLVVAQADQRGRIYRSPSRRPRGREPLPGLRRAAEERGPSRALHQDRDRPPRRLYRDDRGEQAHPWGLR